MCCVKNAFMAVPSSTISLTATSETMVLLFCVIWCNAKRVFHFSRGLAERFNGWNNLAAITKGIRELVHLPKVVVHLASGFFSSFTL